MAEWYYAEGQQQQGPISGEELKDRIQGGQLHQSTLVWNESMRDWMPASRVPYLASPQGTVPPPMGGEAAYATIVVTYAGFWKRFLAVFVDGFVLLIPNFMINASFAFVQFSSGSGPDPTAMAIPQLMNLVVLVAMNWLYFTLFESSRLQATPGKMALGIQVTDLDGNRVSFLRATGRHFAKMINIFTLMIGYMMAGFTAKKQALHDLIAQCLVVNKN